MYLEKLLYGIFEGPGKDEAFRAEWLNFAEERGNAALHERLRQVDPAAAHRLHPNDRLRMIRALEVFHLTGAPISARQVETLTPEHARYDACFIVLNAERDALYARIDARVDAMIAAGFVAEVAELHGAAIIVNCIQCNRWDIRKSGSFWRESAIWRQP